MRRAKVCNSLKVKCYCAKNRAQLLLDTLQLGFASMQNIAFDMKGVFALGAKDGTSST